MAIFATGVSGIVAEYILSTLASYFLGNSVLQWTMILSTMLFSMGVGSRLSKFFKQQLLDKFIFIELLLSVLVSFSSLIVYTCSIYSDFTPLVIYSLSVLIGLLIGMEIPLVIRINEEFQNLRANVSSMLENDYYGSLVGGVFFAFVGLPFLGLTYTPFVLGAVNFAVASLLLLSVHQRLQKPITTLVLTAASLLIIVVSCLFSEPIIRFGEQKKYKDTIIYSEQTRYQKIVLTQFKNHHWLYINGNQQLSSYDEELYHEPLVHPAMKLHPHPQQVLILGGGDGCAVREVLKHPSVQSIDLVDLDPAMTQLGQTHPVLKSMNQNALNSDKVQVFNQDAFSYVEKSLKFYDVVLIDLPDPKSIELCRLYSYEFYQLCFRILRPNGVLVTQAGSPYFAPEAFRCIERSVEAAGFSTVPIHNQVLSLGEWGWIIGHKSLQQQELLQRLRKLNFNDLETTWLNTEGMKMMTYFGKAFFQKVDSIEVNRLHEPVLRDYYTNGAWDLY